MDGGKAIGGREMGVGMSVDELDALQPAQHDPKHVIVGLAAQAEEVLPKIVGY